MEETIGQAVNSLAYPVGGKSSFNRQTEKIAKESGYQMGFSYMQGFYDSTVKNPFNIHRVKLDTNPAIFKAQTILPDLFINR